MNKRISIIFVTFLALTAVSALAETAVDALHLKKINNETVLKIDLSGPFQFSHLAEVAKDGKPHRIIVDLFPAVHNLGQKVFAKLPQSLVASIRTSQYAVKPDHVVRVVLDMQEQAIYRIEKSGNFVFIYIPDNNPAFADWSSKETVAVPVARPETSPEPIAAVVSLPEPSASASAEPQVQEKTEVVSESPAANVPTPAVSEEPAVVLTTEPVTVTEAQSPMATVENLTPVVKYSSPRQSRFIEEELARSSSFASAQPTFNTEAMPVQPTDPSPEVALQELPVETPVTVDSTVVAATEPEPVQQVDSAPAPAVTTTPPQVAETKATDSVTKPTELALKSQDLYHDTGVLVQEISPDDLPAIDPTALAEASLDDSTGQKPTSRFRRDGFFPAKLKGTIVAEFPQRLVIEYAPGVFRDPFETLINETKKSEGPTEKRIPDVETSRLVGVLESSSGKNRALLEDLDGFGYIIKAGDKVKKGYVERIDSDKAFFQLFEYGWSRTIALYLGRN